MESEKLPSSVREYPLLDALIGRRSRRFAAGMEIPDGPFEYRSRHGPHPLSPRERALIVMAAAGVTGWNLGMPHTSSGDPTKGANYPLRPVGRTAPSAAGTHGSELLLADDSGRYITQTRTASAVDIAAAQQAASVEELMALAEKMLVRVSSKPLDIPNSAPHVSAHNRWAAMAPGTTLLVPVADASELFMNFLSIFTGEGVILWDTAADTPIGEPRALVSEGRLDPESKMPIDVFEALIHQEATVDSALMAYNVQLMLQAMGLGGWLFNGMDATSLLGGRAEEGVSGFGFRFVDDPRWHLPNAVGLDGRFESLSPVYTGDTRSAVEAFADRKFGEEGSYTDIHHGPYRDNAVKREMERYDDRLLDYFVSVLDGLLERYGRYPGTMPTIVTSMYVQAQHIDIDFYEAFYSPQALLRTHRSHDAQWHSEEERTVSDFEEAVRRGC